MKTLTPQEAAALSESSATLPAGTAESFAGYAVLGLPLSSGQYLAFRRFPVSSVGPGYHAVWHRSADGDWTVYADAPPEFSCARYFGAALTAARQTSVTATWKGPWQLTVTVPDIVHWELEFESTPVTAAASAMARRMPEGLWDSARFMRIMGKVMGPALHSGKMNLAGFVPNGQSYMARPLQLWGIGRSRATIDGIDAGTPEPLPVQDHLADFWLPQRGLLAAGLCIRFPSTGITEVTAETTRRTEARP